jgi:hypothetical protein
VRAAHHGRERRGLAPALDPRHPIGGGALHGHRLALVAPRRRIGEAHGGHGASDGMERAAPPAHPWIVVQALQRLRGQVLQARAAVDQECLHEDRAQPLVGAGLAVAPALKPRVHGAEGAADRLAAEYPLSEREAVEGAELVERGEAAEQVAVGGDVGPDGLVQPTWPRPLEGVPVLPDQPNPRLPRPAPVGGALLRAPGQHEPDRVQRRAAVKCGVGPMQGKPRSVERRQQAADGGPPRQRRIVAPPSAKMPSQGRQRLLFVRRQCRAAVEAGNIEDRRRRAHAWPAGSTPASMATRQSWICAMPRASLSASSRPERWMY